MIVEKVLVNHRYFKKKKRNRRAGCFSISDPEYEISISELKIRGEKKLGLVNQKNDRPSHQNRYLHHQCPLTWLVCSIDCAQSNHNLFHPKNHNHHVSLSTPSLRLKIKPLTPLLPPPTPTTHLLTQTKKTC